MTAADLQTPTPEHVDSSMLRAAAAHFPTGVAVVSTVDENASPVGCTISSFLSVSLTPPIVAVSLRNNAATLSHIRDQHVFGISVLASGQQSVANLFASAQASHADRFSAVSWRTGGNGVPLIENGLSTLACTVNDVVHAGDHTLILGYVTDVYCQGWGGPLVHHRGAMSSLRAS